MTAQSDKSRKQNPTDETVEVLYQKLGNKWYAFSIIGEEVFVGSIPFDDFLKNHRFEEFSDK